MKRISVLLLSVVLLCTGCGPRGMQGNPSGVMLGAQLGGMIGGLAGSMGSHSYSGRMLGSIIGTVTGAAVGGVLTAPRADDADDDYDEGFKGQRRQVQQPVPAQRRSDLAIRQIRFMDANRDHVIESGEVCHLTFLVMNRSRRTVRNVTPVVEEVTGMKHLFISPTVSVERIPGGEGIKYTATIRAGKRLKSGEAVFRVYALEGNGASTPVKEFSLLTRRRK